MIRQVQLTRRLTLQEVTLVPDDAGGFSESWNPVGTLWADMRPRTARARDGEAVTLSHAGYRAIVRAAPAGSPRRPKAGQRLIEGDRIFPIDAVSDLSAMYLECLVHEEVPA